MSLGIFDKQSRFKINLNINRQFSSKFAKNLKGPKTKKMKNR